MRISTSRRWRRLLLRPTLSWGSLSCRSTVMEAMARSNGGVWSQIGRRLGEAGGGVKEQGRPAMRTGSSELSQWSGAAGKRKEVGHRGKEQTGPHGGGAVGHRSQSELAFPSLLVTAAKGRREELDELRLIQTRTSSDFDKIR